MGKIKELFDTSGIDPYRCMPYEIEGIWCDDISLRRIFDRQRRVVKFDRFAPELRTLGSIRLVMTRPLIVAESPLDGMWRQCEEENKE